MPDYSQLPPDPSKIALTSYRIHQDMERLQAHPYIARLITYINPYKGLGYSQELYHPLVASDIDNIGRIKKREIERAERIAKEFATREINFQALYNKAFPPKT